MNNTHAIEQAQSFLSRIKMDLDKQLVEAIQRTIDLAYYANQVAYDINAIILLGKEAK